MITARVSCFQFRSFSLSLSLSLSLFPSLSLSPSLSFFFLIYCPFILQLTEYCMTLLALSCSSFRNLILRMFLSLTGDPNLHFMFYQKKLFLSGMPFLEKYIHLSGLSQTDLRYIYMCMQHYVEQSDNVQTVYILNAQVEFRYIHMCMQHYVEQ